MSQEILNPTGILQEGLQKAKDINEKSQAKMEQAVETPVISSMKFGKGTLIALAIIVAIIIIVLMVRK